jgi:hypothetical protein
MLAASTDRVRQRDPVEESTLSRPRELAIALDV